MDFIFVAFLYILLCNYEKNLLTTTIPTTEYRLNTTITNVFFFFFAFVNNYIMYNRTNNTAVAGTDPGFQHGEYEFLFLLIQYFFKRPNKLIKLIK